jgi:CubicO group peptidase (beta-lactamase class C family)
MICMKKYLLVHLFFALTWSAQAQLAYFPPLTGNTWETTTPTSLNWCNDRIDALYSYLETTQTKAFLVLKDGKIVLEKYFGTFKQDSLWYWASAGKTVTAFLVGKAQEDGFLNIQNKTSDYLGTGWTNAPLAKENLITVRHQLTMTTGLDDGVANDDCTLPTCLLYKADAGNRWAYHNAPYTLLDKVVENAANTNFNVYYTTKLKNTIGMGGGFVKTGDNNVLYSNARSMARFGLMMLAGGKWNNTNIMQDATYFNNMITTSQNLNLAYGYLWWLNGKTTFMVPTLQTVFQGSLASESPADMYSAMGRNGQFLNIVPSTKLVVIRMGNNADNSSVPFIYNNEIMKRVLALPCTATAVEPDWSENIKLFPNPTQDILRIEGMEGKDFRVSLFNTDKKLIFTAPNLTEIPTKDLPKGIYFVHIRQGNRKMWRKFVKN